MKRFISMLFVMFMCVAAYAHTINWYVGNTVYQTTTCNAGESVTPPTPPIKNGYVFKEWQDHRQIEYLQSTGTQYIDTLYKFVSQHVVIQIAFTKTTSRNDEAVCGCQTGDANYAAILFYRNGYGGIGALAGNTVGNSTFFDIAINTKYEAVYSASNGNLTLSLNNNEKSAKYYGTMNNSANFLLFTTSYDNNLGFIGRWKIYYVKIYDNNTLVRDFIPVLDKDGVACMYDRVEDKFYYNAGTGQFIAGPVVNE